MVNFWKDADRDLSVDSISAIAQGYVKTWEKIFSFAPEFCQKRRIKAQLWKAFPFREKLVP